jgi:two-component system NtrC family sensor kinase
LVPRSVLYSLVLAIGYGGLAGAYIVVSSDLAADSSATVEQMRRIETLKGVAFVAVTMLLMFGGSWLAMRRIDRDANELLRRERALIAAQGKVFAGVMAASVAHDANNVLAAVLADLEILARARDTDRELHLAQLRVSVNRLLALNRRLVSTERNGVPKERQSGDLARLVRDSVATVRSHKSLIGCRVVCEGDPTLPVATQPLLVHQIVSNLVLNAGEAAGDAGVIEVVTRAIGGTAVIEVHDSGPGIPEERHATLFESMTSTKPHGSGLGLYSARACAHVLGGAIEVGRSPLGGALLRVRLPLAS